MCVFLFFLINLSRLKISWENKQTNKQYRKHDRKFRYIKQKNKENYRSGVSRFFVNILFENRVEKLVEKKKKTRNIKKNNIYICSFMLIDYSGAEKRPLLNFFNIIKRFDSFC